MIVYQGLIPWAWIEASTKGEDSLSSSLGSSASSSKAEWDPCQQGGVLLFTAAEIESVGMNAGLSQATSGLLGGMGGGIAQVTNGLTCLGARGAHIVGHTGLRDYG
jgi:hypothetical protein